VRRVTISFQSLEIITLKKKLGHPEVIWRYHKPRIIREKRDLIRRSHIGENNTSNLLAGVGFVVYFAH
jgi:hypothetical protein